MTMALKAWPSPVGTWGDAPTPAATGLWVVRSDAATTFDPGMPYGSYDICVSDTQPNPTRTRRSIYNNKVAGGRPSARDGRRDVRLVDERHAAPA